jgi:CCR4-NOT transcription complex subunit 1
VFKPPKQWTLGIANVLAKLHKFEVKVLCKTLAIDIHDLKPGVVFKDPVTFGTAVVPAAITTNVSTNTTIANHSAAEAAADTTTATT